jgi:hypothetical protein
MNHRYSWSGAYSDGRFPREYDFNQKAPVEASKTTLVEKAGVTAFDNAGTTQCIEEYSDVLPEM